MMMSSAIAHSIASQPAVAAPTVDSSIGGPLAFTVGLLLLNSFFVAAEFALVAARRSRVQALADRGSRGARALMKILDQLDRHIAGAQVGITLASIGLGIFGEPLLAGLFIQLFERLPEPLHLWISHTAATAVAFIIITFVTVVASEQLPKSIALRYAERIAIFITRPLQLFMVLLTPFVTLVNSSTNLLLHLLRLPVAKGHSVTPEELRYVVAQAEEAGVMGAHAADVVRGALRFPNTVVRQVMVHRKDVESIDASLPIVEIYKSAARMKHTRVPVYKGDRDRIAGMLHVKDLLKHDPATLDLSTVLRPALWVTADTPIPELVNALRRKRTRLALVTDEFGAFCGLVTLEDAAEVVLGEVLDEHEQPKAPIPMDEHGRFVVTGATRLFELQDTLDHEFGERAVTVGGFIMRFLGRLPEPGEKVEAEGYEFEIESVSGTQIGKIHVRVPAPPEGGDAGASTA